jgi:hypothetical protein
MTTQPTSGQGTKPTRTLALAGIVYVLAWLIGLVTAPTAPAAPAAASEVNDYFVAHRSAALLQALLVHGLAGIALAAFAVALWGYLTTRAAPPAPARLVLGFGLPAAALSLLQFAIEVGIFVHVGGHGSAEGTRTLFDAVNKADTVKLILLAAFIATATVAARRPRRPAPVGAVDGHGSRAVSGRRGAGLRGRRRRAHPGPRRLAAAPAGVGRRIQHHPAAAHGIARHDALTHSGTLLQIEARW